MQKSEAKKGGFLKDLGKVSSLQCWGPTLPDKTQENPYMLGTPLNYKLDMKIDAINEIDVIFAIHGKSIILDLHP